MHRRPARRVVRAAGALVVGLTAIGVSIPSTVWAAPETGRPTAPRGGDLVFGLEAETTSYCLSRAQLAISGIQVAAAVYDTLTVPNSKGEATPYLAESVVPNDNYTEWTITLRAGVTFHDGTPLDAAALKLNLDSWRGIPGAPNAGPFLPVVFKAWSNVEIVDPLTVKITTTGPSVDLDAGLYGFGRFGIMAPAQINAGEDCSTKMIGTGPFMLESYDQNEATVVVRNPDYWQQGFPKADRITFVPSTDGAVRVNQLRGGQIDLMHTSGAIQIDALRDLSDQIDLVEEEPGYREVRYYILLSDVPPFDNPEARKAFALAVDRKKINQIRNLALFDDANSLADRKAPGYLKNAGYPKFDPKRAARLVEKVKADTGSFAVLLGTTADPQQSAEAQLVKEQLDAVGIDSTIVAFDQATLINKALSRDISVLFWRNLHGGYSTHNSTGNYAWFSNANTGNFLNFAGYDDEAVQGWLDKGRAEDDPVFIEQNYEGFNRAMAKGGYVLPLWYVTWAIASRPDVAVSFPKLPDGHGRPLFLGGRISVLGLAER